MHQTKEQFIRVRSSKFAPLPDEDDEVGNDGMYGKALSQYLQTKLREAGYDVLGFVAEDWGWWVSLKPEAAPTNGICISCRENPEHTTYALCIAKPGARRWSWKQFRYVDTQEWCTQLMNDLTVIFESDPEVEYLGISDDVDVES